MSGARLLVVSPDGPGPLDQGFRIRVHHLVFALAQAGHQVTLLAARGGTSDGQLEELGVEVLQFPMPECPTGAARRLWNLAVGRPTGTHAAAAGGLRPVLNRLLIARTFDAVQVELPDLVDVVAARGVRTVLDAHNIWSELPAAARYSFDQDPGESSAQ